MSEEKIIQHSQKAVDLLKNRSKSIKEKLLGFLEEIVIIIIAVSLTPAFHNWNDRQNEKEIARNFFVGIRQDLVITVPDLQDNVKEFQSTPESSISPGSSMTPGVRYHIFFYRLYLGEKQTKS
jgi:hypothetical protein